MDPLADRIEYLLNIERLFESFFDDNPVPAWHKTYKKRENIFLMDFVNDAYTSHTGVTNTAYKGQEDSAIWTEDTSSTFYLNDLRVVQNRILLPISESFVNPLTNHEEVVVGFKWPSLDLSHRKEPAGVWGLGHFFPKAVWEEIKEGHPHYQKYKEILKATGQDDA